MSTTTSDRCGICQSRNVGELYPGEGVPELKKCHECGAEVTASGPGYAEWSGRRDVAAGRQALADMQLDADINEWNQLGADYY